MVTNDIVIVCKECKETISKEVVNELKKRGIKIDKCPKCKGRGKIVIITG